MLDITGFIRQVVFHVGYQWFHKTSGISCWISMISLDKWSHVGYHWFHKTSGLMAVWISPFTKEKGNITAIIQIG